MHARFAAGSDFLSYLALWEHVGELQREARSKNAFTRRVQAELLSHRRVREWQDTHRHLRAAAREQGLSTNEQPAGPERIHRSLLAGLLSHVGMRPTGARDYQGARGTRFALWPGSVLADRRPPWVAAAELVETSRLFARDVAPIEPEWAERLAGELVARRHGEPWWDRERGQTMVGETVTLYGVPLAADRPTLYAKLDPAGARDWFIRRALVEGDWADAPAFVAENRRRLAELADLEHRARRRDLVAADEDLFALYDARVPEEVTSAARFAAWWAEAGATEPERLTFSREQLLGDAATAIDPADFPDVWRRGDLELAVTYRFEPGAPEDGVTVHVPVEALGQLSPQGFDWQVPGHRAELVTALLRALPKDWRRRISPVAEAAEAVRAGLAHRAPRREEVSEPLVDAVADELRRARGVTVPREAWNLAGVPDHLRVRFAAWDGGAVLAAGRDLAALQRELADEVRGAVTTAAGDLERRGQVDWAFGALPPVVAARRGGTSVRGYPSLVDEGETVGVRVLASEVEQRRAMWTGTRRLLRLTAPLPAKAVQARLDRDAKLALARAPHDSIAALLDDCAVCAIDALVADHGGPAWDAEAFAKLREHVAAGLEDTVVEALGAVRRVLEAAVEVEAQLDRLANPALESSLADARAHLDRLVHPGFVTATGHRRLGDLVRYVRGIAVRLEKLPQQPGRDRERMAEVGDVRRDYIELLRRLGPEADEAVHEVRWQLEELRVQLFAERLGARGRVSAPRIRPAIATLGAERAAVSW
jgi:ATP-dependent helicase HrpA